MILYPAIDLKDGKCVRLVKGEMDAATVFSDDPVAQAKSFATAGCRWLHIVDLNGAFEGQPVNSMAVEQIVNSVDVRVQLGGGVRDMDTISYWLSRGVSRIILGTIALNDPEFVYLACEKFPERIAVGIDVRGEYVAVEGWSKTSSVRALQLANLFEDAGVAAIIFTDINRDGAMQGPNIEATAALARQISTPIIASGGVSNYGDLESLKAKESEGIEGVICGRALYDGRIDICQAQELLAS